MSSDVWIQWQLQPVFLRTRACANSRCHSHRCASSHAHKRHFTHRYAPYVMDAKASTGMRTATCDCVESHKGQGRVGKNQREIKSL